MRNQEKKITSETSSRVKELIEVAKEKKHEVCIWGAGNAGKTGLRMLQRMGVSVDFYCDKNPDLWGREIVDNIKCISPDEIRNRDIICFVMASVLYIQEICNDIKALGIKKIITYDELCEVEIKDYFPFKARKQIAVYTCIVGDYDLLKEPISISEECDYYVISDKKPKTDSVFQYIDIRECIPEYLDDNTKKNRYCKINAHKLFPKYRYSIYFDGNMILKSNIVQTISELPKTRIITLAKNPINCIYMEAMRAIELGRVNKNIAMKQVEKYWLEGMPENFGSVICSILIREHNNFICRKIMEDWWNQVEQFSRKDQIAFPYVIWKNNYSMNDVATLNGEEIHAEKYLFWDKLHNKPRYANG